MKIRLYEEVKIKTKWPWHYNRVNGNVKFYQLCPYEYCNRINFLIAQPLSRSLSKSIIIGEVIPLFISSFTLSFCPSVCNAMGELRFSQLRWSVIYATKDTNIFCPFVYLSLLELCVYRYHPCFIIIDKLFIVPIKNDAIQYKWPMIGQYTD